jgi:amidase
MSVSKRVPRTALQYAYDRSVPAIAEVASGCVVVFETDDARGGSLLDRPLGVPYPLPPPIEGKGNPVSGPVAVTGAQVGDAIAVKVLAIECGPVGWCGAHAYVGPLTPGRVPAPIGRTCAVRDGFVEYSDSVQIPVRPMIGCIGVAPAGDPVSTALAGPHGGNMDQTVVAAGATILLPVLAPGGLVSNGDIHAVQGQGELSGVGLEIEAEVTVELELRKDAAPAWPWLLSVDRVAVLTRGDTFEESHREAIDALVTVLEQTGGYATADAVALLSLIGDAYVGAAWGGPMVTTRVEVPRRYIELPFDGCPL